MPNDCWNTLTIKGDDQQIKDIYNNHLLNYVTMEQNKLIKKGRRAIKVNMWSAWEPDYDFLHLLKNTYPSIWIKNEWNEEGGGSGVWIYNDILDLTNRKVEEFSWNDMCLEEYDYVFNC